ncbi:MAG: adenylate kinase [Patescibacteria group bacterium]
MLNFIIFGTPGAGKGTQAELIAKEYGLFHLSTGQALRQELESGELGSEIKQYVDQGILVPYELIVKMVNKAIAKNINCPGFIFDGYPRSLSQAEALQNFFEENDLHLDAVINLEIGEEEAKKRIILRGKTSGRSDDNPETISTRFHTYHEQTKPLLDYYQASKKIINIDGEPDIEAVAKNIDQEIEHIKKPLQ